MTSEMWEPPILFRAVKENMNISLHSSNKNIKKKVI